MNLKKHPITFLLIFFIAPFCVHAQVNNSSQLDESTLLKRLQEFLLPNSIFKNITNRVTKERIVNDLNLRLISHRGGIDYYEVGDAMTGLHFSGQILDEVSFRYFGEEGLDYENSMLKAGFVLEKRAKTSNLEIGGVDATDINGEVRIYRKGSIILPIFETKRVLC
jgi:hypothetical protein